jgi:recA bacterial DNA recombination protein
MAALPKLSRSDLSTSIPAFRPPPHTVVESRQALEFSGVFRGHELTRKDRRLSSGLASLDALIGGGVPRGRISEITGRAGSGKTSIAASFASFATHRGEVAAWLDASGTFDPESMAAAGVELRRMLWASMKMTTATPATPARNGFAPAPLVRRQSAIVKAAELVLEAGGFGLVVIDFGETPRTISQASALRIARAAERSSAAVIAIAPWRMCGTFAALSLSTSRAETSFSRLAPDSPVTFDGLAVTAMVARNKMGGTGRFVRMRALVDPIEYLTDYSTDYSTDYLPTARAGSRGWR